MLSDPSASARTIGEDTIKGTMKHVPKQWGTMLGGRQMKDKSLLDLKDLEKQRDEMLRQLKKKKATNRNRTIWPDALADVQKSLTLADCTAELKEDLLAVNNDEALIFNERLKIREKIKSKLNAFRQKETSTAKKHNLTYKGNYTKITSFASENRDSTESQVKVLEFMTHANSQPEKQILTDKELELFELARKVLNNQIQDVYEDEENWRREKEYYWSVKKDEIVNPHDESKNQTKIEINWQYLGRPHPFVLLSHLSTLLDLDFSMEFWRNDGLKPGILEKSDSNEIKGNITGIATFMNIYLVAEHLIENPEKKSILADLILKKLYPKQHYLEPGNRLLLEGFAPLDNGEETTEEQDTVAQLQDLGDYYYLEDDEYLKKTMFKEEKRQKIAKIMKENLIALKENQTLSPQQKLDRTRKMKEIYDQKTTQFSLPSYHLLIKKFGNPWVNVLRYNCNLHDLRDRYKLVRVEKEENNFNKFLPRKLYLVKKFQGRFGDILKTETFYFSIPH